MNTPDSIENCWGCSIQSLIDTLVQIRLIDDRVVDVTFVGVQLSEDGEYWYACYRHPGSHIVHSIHPSRVLVGGNKKENGQAHS